MAAAAGADNGMSVTSLSDSPQFPCVLLQMPRLTILLDCALDTTTALNFLPLDLIPKATLVGNVSLDAARLRLPLSHIPSCRTRAGNGAACGLE